VRPRPRLARHLAVPWYCTAVTGRVSPCRGSRPGSRRAAALFSWRATPARRRSAEGARREGSASRAAR